MDPKNNPPEAPRKLALNLPSVPQQIFDAITQLAEMAKRAPGTFDEHVSCQQAEIFLKRRFQTVADPKPEKSETNNPSNP